jgi:hypothetical protein
VRGIPVATWDVTLLSQFPYFQNNPTMSEFVLNQKLQDIRSPYEKVKKKFFFTLHSGRQKC